VNYSIVKTVGLLTQPTAKCNNPAVDAFVVSLYTESCVDHNDNEEANDG
jgi:hypothetical protein